MNQRQYEETQERLERGVELARCEVISAEGRRSPAFVVERRRRRYQDAQREYDRFMEDPR